MKLVPDLRPGGILCSRKYIACGCRSRYVFRTRGSEIHPTRVDALVHLLGRPSVAIRDADLLERFRPACTRNCKGSYVKSQNLTQLGGHFIRAYHWTQLDDEMP